MDKLKRTNIYFQIDVPTNRQISRIVIKKNGDLLLLDPEGEKIEAPVRRQLGYETPERLNKQKGPKIQSRGTFENTSIGGLKELTQFDSIFAIDTNTPRENKSVSVSCFCGFKVTIEGESYWAETLPNPQIYEFHGSIEKPELLAILKLANAVVAKVQDMRDKKFLIVTDTEINKLSEINSRQTPIYSDQYLPEGFQLIYASADTGRELPNIFIRFCDSQADKYLEHLRRGELPARTYFPVREDSSMNFAQATINGLMPNKAVVNKSKISEDAQYLVTAIS